MTPGLHAAQLIQNWYLGLLHHNHLLEQWDSLEKGKTVVNQFLMAPQVPITLIGRDILCKLDDTIKTAPQGLTLQCLTKITKQKLTPLIRPEVYWIGKLEKKK